jgi:hypothetical protein
MAAHNCVFCRAPLPLRGLLVCPTGTGCTAALEAQHAAHVRAHVEAADPRCLVCLARPLERLELEEHGGLCAECSCVAVRCRTSEPGEVGGCPNLRKAS